MDGGTTWNVNLVKAVQRCRETVDSDSKIYVDILMCGSHHEDNWNLKDDTINNYLRNKEIKDYHGQIGDVHDFKKAFPNVNFRYFVAPSESLPGGLAMLDFSNKTTWGHQMLGRKDGANAIKLGEEWAGKMFDKWDEQPEMQQNHLELGKYVSKEMVKGK